MGHFEADVDVRKPDATRAAARLPSIIGQSMAMRRLVATVARVAPKDVTVLVRGETGTGKELIASLVHTQSRRSQGPLVRFNCAAIPGELAESELFGHVQGAFTGATHARRGFFAQADGGTLVLDEVGELPPAIQAKLLRALQGGEIQPVGAARVEHADVRVVACTNRDLAAEVRAGRFREDLYYRLAVLEFLVSTAKTSLPWLPNSPADMACASATRESASPRHSSKRSVGHTGLATSGSSRTLSPGWWRCAAPERSAWMRLAATQTSSLRPSLASNWNPRALFPSNWKRSSEGSSRA